MPIRVLVADDHDVVRTGLVNLLSGADIEVVAQTASGEETIRLAAEHKPDVVLLDVRLGEEDGLEILERLSDQLPEPRVIVFSTFENPTYVARAMALGAADYLLKGCSREELLDVVSTAARREGPSKRGELHKVAEVMRDTARAECEVPLTMREAQVLRHLALGLSNREIGRSLGISIETVKEHVQHLLRKLSLADRTQAAVWAVRRQMV